MLSVPLVVTFPIIATFHGKMRWVILNLASIGKNILSVSYKTWNFLAHFFGRHECCKYIHHVVGSLAKWFYWLPWIWLEQWVKSRCVQSLKALWNIWNTSLLMLYSYRALQSMILSGSFILLNNSVVGFSPSPNQLNLSIYYLFNICTLQNLSNVVMVTQKWKV